MEGPHDHDVPASPPRICLLSDSGDTDKAVDGSTLAISYMQGRFPPLEKRLIEWKETNEVISGLIEHSE